MSIPGIVRCHCGAVELAVNFPYLPEELLPMRCNCSICSRKGAVMVGVPRANVEIVKGADALTLYQWNTKVAEHYFCSICGIYTHHQRRRDPTQIGINVGCIDGLDARIFADVPVFDGASLSVSSD